VVEAARRVPGAPRRRKPAQVAEAVKAAPGAPRPPKTKMASRPRMTRNLQRASLQKNRLQSRAAAAEVQVVEAAQPAPGAPSKR